MTGTWLMVMDVRLIARLSLDFSVMEEILRLQIIAKSCAETALILVNLSVMMAITTILTVAQVFAILSLDGIAPAEHQFTKIPALKFVEMD
jgi:hypothetical protein